MATSRYQPADLRRQVGSPRPKGRGSFALTIPTQTQTPPSSPNADLGQRIKIPYAETSLFMAIVDTKIKAVLSATIKTKTTPIQTCRSILFLVVYCFGVFLLCESSLYQNLVRLRLPCEGYTL
jgi:hypothetical protein